MTNKINESAIKPAAISVAVVGLGLMGCSITTCLLMAGHSVIAVAPIPDDMLTAVSRISEHLKKSFEEGLTDKTPEALLKQLHITEDYKDLRHCALVIECTIEDIGIKKTVYAKIEAAVDDQTIITSIKQYCQGRMVI